MYINTSLIGIFVGLQTKSILKPTDTGKKIGEIACPNHQKIPGILTEKNTVSNIK